MCINIEIPQNEKGQEYMEDVSTLSKLESQLT